MNPCSAKGHVARLRFEHFGDSFYLTRISGHSEAYTKVKDRGRDELSWRLDEFHEGKASRSPIGKSLDVHLRGDLSTV